MDRLGWKHHSPWPYWLPALHLMSSLREHVGDTWGLHSHRSSPRLLTGRTLSLLHAAPNIRWEEQCPLEGKAQICSQTGQDSARFLSQALPTWQQPGGGKLEVSIGTTHHFSRAPPLKINCKVPPRLTDPHPGPGDFPSFLPLSSTPLACRGSYVSLSPAEA